MTYDSAIHHRRSLRLKDRDYTQPGAYFITIVSHHRQEIFGQVFNEQMELSPLGGILRDEWLRSFTIRKEICLHTDEFVVMPNHMHAIVWMLDPLLVGADGVRPPGPASNKTIKAHTDLPLNLRSNHEPGANIKGGRRPPLQGCTPGSLSAFLSGFKASVTSRARRELYLTDIWQRNFYDHIARNEAEIKGFWDYIDDNPRKWEEDQLHPSAPPNKFNQE